MIIWTVKEGEPLPLEECKGRIMRCGILSEMLSERGHEVLWWTSDFLHQTKERLKAGPGIVDQGNLKLNLLHAPVVYKRNISLFRVLYSLGLARQFKKNADKFPKPDVIYCSFPLIDLSYAVVRYAKQNGIPVILDVRDLWPDIMYDQIPKPARWLGKLLISPLERKTKKTFSEADIITATVPFDLEWARKKAGRTGNQDRVFYMGYEVAPVSEEKKAECDAQIKEWGIRDDDFLICYFGNLSGALIDFDAILKASKELTNRPGIRFVLCGTSGAYETMKAASADRDNILMPGYVGPEMIARLMERAGAGIIPYKDRWDFREAIPNKAVEYLAGGLPVLSELSGCFGQMAEENHCGKIYRDAASLAGAARVYFEHPEELSKAKAAAKALYERSFRKEQVYGAFCDFVENTANEKRNGITAE